MKKSSAKIFFGLIFLVFVGFLAVSLSQNTSSDSNQNESKDLANSDQELTEKNIPSSFSGTIVYVVLESEGTDIYMIDLDGKNEKKIFTDKDEDLKIKSIGGLSNQGDNFFALLASKNQVFGGTLYLISTDGKGTKNQLIDNFASPQTPLISSNGKKISYVLFSNAELDYGYSLISMDLNGDNKQKLDQSTTNLTLLAWASDGKKIAYLKQENNQDTIYIADITNNKIEKISSFKEKIYSLSWSEDKMVFAKGPSDENSLNQSEIFIMGQDGKNLQRLTNDKKHDNYPLLSKDGKTIVYFSTEYDSKSQSVNASKNGDLYLVTNNGENQTKLTSANNIIGWIK